MKIPSTTPSRRATFVALGTAICLLAGSVTPAITDAASTKAHAKQHAKSHTAKSKKAAIKHRNTASKSRTHATKSKSSKTRKFPVPTRKTNPPTRTTPTTTTPTRTTSTSTTPTSTSPTSTTPTGTTPTGTTPTSTTPTSTTPTGTTPTSTTPTSTTPTSTTPTSTTPPASAAAQPGGIAGNWNLVMDSEFNTGALNTNVWTPGWWGSGVTNPVNGDEDNCYNSNNVIATGSALDLNVTDQASTCNGKTYPYTGSLVSTMPNGSNTGFTYTYGVVEARVYLPAAANGQIANWPAVWATTTPNETYSEDDVFEGLSGQACYHYHDTAAAPGACDTTLTPGWHTFASDWQPGTITYYYDGTKVGSETCNTDQPMYLLLDNTTSASNLSFAGASTMQVQYVRVWQR